MSTPSPQERLANRSTLLNQSLEALHKDQPVSYEGACLVLESQPYLARQRPNRLLEAFAQACDLERFGRLSFKDVHKEPTPAFSAFAARKWLNAVFNPATPSVSPPNETRTFVRQLLEEMYLSNSQPTSMQEALSQVALQHNQPWIVEWYWTRLEQDKNHVAQNMLAMRLLTIHPTLVDPVVALNPQMAEYLLEVIQNVRCAKKLPPLSDFPTLVALCSKQNLDHALTVDALKHKQELSQEVTKKGAPSKPKVM